MAVKNIIFDLGGVIINLDPEATAQAFTDISGINFSSIYSQSSQIEIFNLFDKGLISDFEFFQRLRKELRFNGPDETLLKAWNAMLLDVPSRRLDLLLDMKLRYRTFLLSNTCETHIEAFENDLYMRHGLKNFNDYFERVYYSCRTGMRKPDKEIFLYVLNENNLEPGETVFIDDSTQHVKAAGECGIRSYILPKGMDITQLVKELGLL